MTINDSKDDIKATDVELAPDSADKQHITFDDEVKQVGGTQDDQAIEGGNQTNSAIMDEELDTFAEGPPVKHMNPTASLAASDLGLGHSFETQTSTPTRSPGVSHGPLHSGARAHVAKPTDIVSSLRTTSPTVITTKDIIKIFTDDDDVIEVTQEQLQRVKTMHRSFEEGATFSFNYNMLLFVASILAGLGLVTNSGTTIIASMLVSPIMGPVMGLAYGSTITDWQLVKKSIKNEIISLFVCIVMGIILGCMTGPTSLSKDWPTDEMKSRGTWTNLIVAIPIAFFSGLGVAVSVLDSQTSSLVGVAISASLLPPAVNAGILWIAYAFNENDILREYAPETDCGGFTCPTQTTPPLKPPKTIPPASDSPTFLSDIPTMFESQSPTDLSRFLLEVAAAAKAAGASETESPSEDKGYSSSADYRQAGMISLLITLENIALIWISGMLMFRMKEVLPIKKKVFWEDLGIARKVYKKQAILKSDADLEEGFLSNSTSVAPLN